MSVNTNLVSTLLSKGLIELDQAKVIEIEQEKTKKSAECLVKELGFISSDMLLEVVSNKAKIKHINLKTTNINVEISKQLEKEFCLKHQLIAYDEDANHIFLGMVKELEISIKDLISRKFNKKLKFNLVDEDDLKEALDYVFSVQKDKQSWVSLLNEDYSDNESFATRLVYELVSHCIKQGVSDIHLEPEEYFVRIRLRKDGMLKPLCVFPKEKWGGLCVKIKLLADMDISQSFIPQDGRFNFQTFGRKVDLRVSTRPVVHGENLIIRILDTKGTIPQLEDLGYTQGNLEELNKVLKQTSGIFIVTGPTGSGKSTLLFSMLSRLCKPSVSIATVEDPVEYTHSSFRQTDMSTYKNMTFSGAIRSILRQDPDIISISEVRDSDTATMAMRAAMTGRMLLTTLHTNDIFGVFDRLRDLGVEKGMLIHHLNGVATQRLVRKVCDCCEVRPPTDEERELLAPYDVDNVKCAKGCSKCDYSGYSGRFAVSQILHIDEKIRNMLVKESIDVVKDYLYKNKLKSLHDEMKLRVIKGETTLVEVNRVFCLR